MKMEDLNSTDGWPGAPAEPLERLYGDDRALVICATSRLAQAVRQAEAQVMRQAGRVQWTPMKALTFDLWFEQLQAEVSLQGLCDAPALQALPMDSEQERLLWERVIREDLGESTEFLFDVAALTRTAMEAHELCVVWGVTVPDRPLSDEARRFAVWQQRFLAECAQRRWIDRHRLRQALVDTLPKWFDALPWPERVAYIGFTRFNPIEQRWQSALKSLGAPMVLAASGEHDDAASSAAQVQCHAYPDTAAEVLAAALWVQQRWQANPKARLAIVVPDLAGTRHLLEDTLDDVLMPEAISPRHAEAARPYNISLGAPLSGRPLVHTALTLLQVLADADKVPQAVISQLLRSPYWSDGANESAARAVLDAAMRKRLPPSAPLELFRTDLRRQLASRSGTTLQAPQLLRHVDQLAQALSALHEQRLPSEWAIALPALLRQVGWLAGRKLSSHEYQTHDALLGIIHQLGRLDDWLGRVPYAAIVSQLRRACADRTFQVQTEGQPLLQVMGVLETSGLHFDGLWVMGMVDSAWPPAARPNALLPGDQQRERQSPNASATVQLQFAQALQAHWLRGAPEVTFSWPRTLGDAELNPSPLLPDTGRHHQLGSPQSPHWTWQVVKGPNPFLALPIEDTKAPPLQDGERVSGGTWMLKAQAICPAWAFYQYRLGASRLEQATEGLDARARGTFLHDAMEHFWKAVRNSAHLKGLGAADRQAHVEAAVEHVLAAYDQNPAHTPLKPRFAQLERARLVRLIMGWLDVEAQRHQGFEVIHTEKECVLEIEGIRIKLFIDRIDLLDDGSALVMDYKTGATIDTKNWASDRLTEPQLPIYAALAPPDEGPVHGVVFAKVLMREPGWAGLAQRDLGLAKVTPLESKAGRKLFPPERFERWDHVLEHWRERIRAIAREVRAGDAGVRFADAHALLYCDVRPLLRLSERQSQLDAALASTSAPGDAE